MSIYENIESFYGLSIENYKKEQGIQNSDLALKVSVDYEAGENGEEIKEVLTSVLADAKAKDLKALIIGSWEESFETDIQPLIDLLIEKKDTLTNLKAIFFAEMTSEENEMSWIQQGDYSSFWAAFPKLEHFQSRGMEGLELGDISHENIKVFILETGGLDKEELGKVASANLPSLQHLEVWLGDEYYGWDGDINDVEKLLGNEKFGAVTYLGIKNSEISDEIAKLVSTHPILGQLKTLDLSMGTLGDEGAQALLDNKDKLSHLDLLNLNHHYMSDEMMKKITDIGVTVSVEEQEEEDDDDRYVAVSE